MREDKEGGTGVSRIKKPLLENKRCNAACSCRNHASASGMPLRQRIESASPRHAHVHYRCPGQHEHRSGNNNSDDRYGHVFEQCSSRHHHIGNVELV